jgi:hypothetical protein
MRDWRPQPGNVVWASSLYSVHSPTTVYLARSPSKSRRDGISQPRVTGGNPGSPIHQRNKPQRGDTASALREGLEDRDVAKEVIPPLQGSTTVVNDGYPGFASLTPGLRYTVPTGLRPLPNAAHRPPFILLTSSLSTPRCGRCPHRAHTHDRQVSSPVHWVHSSPLRPPFRAMLRDYLMRRHTARLRA